MSNTPADVLGWLSAAVATAMLLYKSWAERKKLTADASSVITNTALSLLRPLEERVNAQEQEIDTLRCEVRMLAAGVNLLIGQIRALGAEPVWTPESGRKE